MAQCSLAPGTVPAIFEPAQNSGNRPSKFGPGYTNNLDLYRQGASNRLMVMENFGYAIFDLGNPTAPAPLGYHDLTQYIPLGGDAQSAVKALGVSADGQRAIINWYPGSNNNVVLSPSGYVFWIVGDFLFSQASGGVVITKATDGRYFGWALYDTPPMLRVADISNPPGTTAPNSIASETAPFPGGSGLLTTGPYVVYKALSGDVVVINAANPGRTVGSYSTSLPSWTIPSSAWGRPATDVLLKVTAAVDPLDSSASPALYLLAEFMSGRNSGGFSLMTLKQGQTSVVGAPFQPLSPFSGTGSNYGGRVHMAPMGGDLLLFMWTSASADASHPRGLFRLYTTNAKSWPGAPAYVEIDPTVYTSFVGPGPMRVLSTSSTSYYAYIATVSGAYVLPLSCVATNSPAAADLTVEPEPCPGGVSPCPYGDGQTVFLGDTLKVTPIINPPPSSRPLTEWYWNLDLDFHAGVPFDDAGTGTSPRVKSPDNAALGGGTTPPTSFYLVGPCDPNVAGVNVTNGTNCWASVTGNGAFAGGAADFAANPPAGTAKTVALAFEAKNALGSSNTKVFNLTWKVPAVRLAATSLLLGSTLSDASDGHPVAAGYRWYFGANPSAPAVGETLTRDPSCNDALACRHAFPGKGSYNYWITVPYANGYTSPGCGSPCTQTLGAVAVTDVLASFSAPAAVAQGPLTFPVTNLSIVAPAVSPCPAGGGYQYDLCGPSATACAAGSYQDVAFSGGIGTVPIPAAAGTHWLRIRYNYTPNGSCASPLTAQWTPNVGGVPDPTAWPVAITAVVPEIHVKVNGFDACGAGPGGGTCIPNTFSARVGDILTAYAFVGGVPDPNPPAAGLSWSFGDNSSPPTGTGQGVTFTYTAAGSPVVTLTGYGLPQMAQGTVAGTGTGRFYTLPPCRVIDTRNPAGPLAGPALAASSPRVFTVTGTCGIPAYARSLAVNVTVVQPGAPGNLELYPGDAAAAGTSAINFDTGQTRTNNAILPLAGDLSGKLGVQNDATGVVHFILDVNGFFD